MCRGTNGLGSARKSFQSSTFFPSALFPEQSARFTGFNKNFSQDKPRHVSLFQHRWMRRKQHGAEQGTLRFNRARVQSPDKCCLQLWFFSLKITFCHFLSLWHDLAFSSVRINTAAVHWLVKPPGGFICPPDWWRTSRAECVNSAMPSLAQEH